MQDGRPLEVIPLPMPRPIYLRRPAAAGLLLQFLHRQRRGDRAAVRRSGRRRVLEILARLFPDRQIVGSTRVDLVWGLGAFHCITQQEPAITKSSAGN